MWEEEAERPWRPNDRRLRWALLCSLLIHTAFLALQLQSKMQGQSIGRPVLTVVLQPASDEARRQTAATSDAKEGRRAAQVTVSQASYSIQSSSKGQAGPVVPELPTPAVAGSETRPQPLRPGSSSPGDMARAMPQAGGVSVLLAIGEGGRVEHIHWDRLPALTDEQLRRVEAALRARTYAGFLVGQAVNETIDVKALLASGGSP